MESLFIQQTLKGMAERRQALLRHAVIWTLSAAAGFALLGDNLQAQWGLTDDHEIAYWLGADGKTPWAEFLPLLMTTEAGSPGSGLRFRPSYYTLRIAETVLWGNAPQVWYGVRLAGFITMLALFWQTLSRWIGVLPAGVALGFMLTFPFWGDVFCRLGPAETYAAVGLAFYAYTFIRLLERLRRRESIPAWLCVVSAVSAVVCIGSKENFLILAVPTTFLAWMALRGERRAWSLVCSCGVVAVFSGFVIWATILILSSTGQDVYGSDVGPRSRMSLLGLRKGGMWREIFWYSKWGYVLSFLALSATATACILKLRKVPREVLVGGGWLAVITVFYASQFVFYNGALPSLTRYDFPAMLAMPLFWLTLLWMCGRLLHHCGLSARGLSLARVVLILGVACLTCLRGFDSIRKSVHGNVTHTNQFTARIQSVARSLSVEPERPLIIYVTQARDYEGCISVGRFLRTLGVSNTLAIMTDWTAAAPFMSPGQDAALRSDMDNWSKDGYKELFVRTTDLCDRDKPFVLGVSGTPPATAHSLGTVL